jgi:hypothetical protein
MNFFDCLSNDRLRFFYPIIFLDTGHDVLSICSPLDIELIISYLCKGNVASTHFLKGPLDVSSKPVYAMDSTIEIVC